MPQDEALFDAQRMAWYIFHVTKDLSKNSQQTFFSSGSFGGI